MDEQSLDRIPTKGERVAGLVISAILAVASAYFLVAFCVAYTRSGDSPAEVWWFAVAALVGLLVCSRMAYRAIVATPTRPSPAQLRAVSWSFVVLGVVAVLSPLFAGVEGVRAVLLGAACLMIGARNLRRM